MVGGSVLEMNLDLLLHSFLRKEIPFTCLLDVKWIFLDAIITYNVTLFINVHCHIHRLYIPAKSIKAKEGDILPTCDNQLSFDELFSCGCYIAE